MNLVFQWHQNALIYRDPVIHEKSQGLTSLYDIKVKIKRIIDGQSII